MSSSSSNTPSAPSAPKPITYQAVPNKIMVAMNGILSSSYSIVVTAKLNSFLVFRGRFDSKQFDLVVYDARTILQLLERFSTCLANQHIHVWGEYATSAYCKDRTGYPSHSVKLQNLQDAHGHTYSAYTARDLAPMYDLFLAHKLYTCWQDPAMRTTKASHKDYYQKYKKLYIDFFKAKGEDVEPPPIVALADTLNTRTSRKRQLHETDPTTIDSVFDVNKVSGADVATSSSSKSLLQSGDYFLPPPNSALSKLLVLPAPLAKSRREENCEFILATFFFSLFNKCILAKQANTKLRSVSYLPSSISTAFDHLILGKLNPRQNLPFIIL